MEIEILYQPSYSTVRIQLASGETIRAETGAMVAMKSVEVETRMRGGLFRSLTRSAFGGETFFVNTFKAKDGGGEVILAPTLPGDVSKLTLEGDTYYVQSGSYLASAETVELDTRWTGARTFFSGEGLIMLSCTGSGELLISSYGAIHEINLGEGEKTTVDTGHLVAFQTKVGYEVRLMGGIKTGLLGGEGLVVELTGPGKVLLQTRSEGAFLDWLLPRLPKPGEKSG